jgi:DNA-binding phage protein/uncharacterized protein YdbL (DUF1318 family)
MAALDQKFKGQALARLDTYAGKMDLLRVNAANATEIIGKGLIDALSILGKDNSINQAANSMNGFATAIANTTKGMAELIAEVKKIIDSDVGKFLLGIAALLTLGRKTLIAGAAGIIAYDIGKSGTQKNVGGYSGIPDLRVTRDLTKARKEEYKIIAAKNAIENKNLEELKKKFDIERIGLTAALNSATDEETKLRIRAQLAILDENDALAKKIIAELEATEALRKLAEQARLAGMSLEDFALFKIKTLNTKIDDYLQNTALQMVRALNAQIASFISSLSGVTGIKTDVTSNVPSGGVSGFAGTFDPARVRMGEERSMADLKITVDTAQTGDRFAQLVAESIQIATKSGISYGIAGGL